MLTLFEALERTGGAQSRSLAKHLKACGLNEWADLTKSNIMAFRDHLRDSLAPNSAKTLCAAFTAFLHRYEEEQTLPKNFSELLKVKGDEVVKTYLNRHEIEQLEQVRITTTREQFVLNEFLVACKTGARISDVMAFTPENIANGCLTYVSQKTHRVATMPVSKTTVERIEWLQTHYIEMNRAVTNGILKRLGQRAKLDTMVKLHIHGKDITAPKWTFLSTHYGRISCASIMEELGVPMNDIRLTLGHSNMRMTESYCKRRTANLNKTALEYFK